MLVILALHLFTSTFQCKLLFTFDNSRNAKIALQVSQFVFENVGLFMSNVKLAVALKKHSLFL